MGASCPRSCPLPCIGRFIKPISAGRTHSSDCLRKPSAATLWTGHLTLTGSKARLMTCQHRLRGSVRRSRSCERRSANCAGATSNSGAGTRDSKHSQRRTRITLRARPRLTRRGANAPGACGDTSGRRPGGQRGHCGATLRLSARPDRIVEHRPHKCRDCHAPLSAAQVVRHHRQQVVEVVPARLRVTEHRLAVVRCQACGRTTQGEFAGSVRSGVQYGVGARPECSTSSSICCCLTSGRAKRCMTCSAAASLLGRSPTS